jgi:hypothetical protein
VSRNDLLAGYCRVAILLGSFAGSRTKMPDLFTRLQDALGGAYRLEASWVREE